MLLDYYGLREQPFGVTPDPRFLYSSPARQEALAALLYGIEMGRGFLALVGPPGTGKTTLLFQLLDQLQGSARTAFLFQTQCDSREFFRYLLDDLGIEPREQNLAQMHAQLNEALLAEARAGRRFVMIIDEAQNLDDSVLETVRLLSNFETVRAKLLQIILAGQPRLADKLASPGLLQLRQRISILSHLDPFSAAETSEYIAHRLRVAGYEGPPLFSVEARAIISARSRGIPRDINNLCFNALSIGCVLGKKVIDSAVMQEVLRDLDLGPLVSHPLGAHRVPASPLGAAVVPFAEPPAADPPAAQRAVGGANPLPRMSQLLDPGNSLASSSVVARKATAPSAIESDVSPAVAGQPNPAAPSLPRTSTDATLPSSAPRSPRVMVSRLAKPPRAPVSPARTSPSRRLGWLWSVAVLIVLGVFAAGYWYWVKFRPSTRQAPGATVSASTASLTSAGTSKPDAAVAAPVAPGRAPDAAPGSDLQPQTREPKPIVPSAPASRARSAPVQRPGRAPASSGLPASLKAAPAGRSPSRRAAQAASGSRPRVATGSSRPSPTLVALREEDQTADDTGRGTPPANAGSRKADGTTVVSQASGPSTSGQVLVLSRAANLQMPQLIAQRLPQYPRPARQAGVEGVVRMVCLVGREGSVEEADIVSGPPLLRDAALEAVMRWRFKPALLNGVPVEVQVQTDVKFSLR